MPQLMSLYWMSYMIIFAVLFFMMKGVYSVYILESGLSFMSKNSNSKDMWFW